MARLRSFLRFTVAVVLLDVGCGGGGGGTPPPPTRSIEKAPTSGDNQTGNAGQPLAAPLAVLVKENGSPKAGVSVTWAATVGSGTVTAPGTSTTDANGIATTVLTPGSDSVVQRVTATLTNALGSPQTFNATARIQGATQIALAPGNSGDGQTDTVLATLSNPYRVILRDEANTPVTGVNVSWSVPGGQGSTSSGSSVSGVGGIAAVTRILGSTAGAQTAQASVKGLTGNPVAFTATATAGDAFAIAANGGAGSHTVNGSFPLSAIVRDMHDNPKAGVQVTWVADAGTGSVSPTQSATGADGIATTTRTLGGAPGSYKDTASANGLQGPLQGSPVVFAITAFAAPATAAVDVGDNFFRSMHNNTQNPAVDTIAVGGKVTWTWVGLIGHSVQSTGSPSFTSSAIQAGAGKSYQFTFNNAGTYEYDCAVHGALMTGRVVVVP